MRHQLNRHGAALIAMALLVLACVALHNIASIKVGLSHMFALMDLRTAREVELIKYVNSHLWLPAFYIIAFASCLIWLEIRNAPRWAVWVTFSLLALPCLGYLRACAHIGNKIITLSG